MLGASGFVGRHLVRHLSDEGITVVGLSSAEADLCQSESIEALTRLLREDDTLVFASALTPDKGKDAGTLMKNLAMAQHVSLALQRARCAQVVYVSSDAMYADGITPIRETSHCDPSTFHGLMHLAREKMLAQALAPSKTPFFCVRPCSIYGAQDTHNSYGPNRFLRTALAERKITLFGEGEEKRDHISIDDVVRVIGLGILHHSEGIVNVATGRAMSFFDVARMVASLCEEEVRLECLPRTSPITHRHFDIAALLRAFPTFRATPLDAGLRSAFIELSTSHGRTQPVASLSSLKAEHRRA